MNAEALNLILDRIGLTEKAMQLNHQHLVDTVKISTNHLAALIHLEGGSGSAPEGYDNLTNEQKRDEAARYFTSLANTISIPDLREDVLRYAKLVKSIEVKE